MILVLLRTFPSHLKTSHTQAIVNHAIQANNFELKLPMFQIVQQNQFFSSPTEDPNFHISVFVQYTDTSKNNGINP